MLLQYSAKHKILNPSFSNIEIIEMLTHHSVKNPTTASCVLCCCYVEASAAATLVRYKLGKNLGGAIHQGTARRS